MALGRGGLTVVAAATGLARNTVRDGVRELRTAVAEGTVAIGGEPALAASGGGHRQRRAGGGRQRLTHHDPDLLGAWEALIEPTTRGDPQAPLRWTTKSTRQLANALTRQGHPGSAAPVAMRLHQLRYGLHALRKTRAGTSHPDRDAQFKHIAATVSTVQARGQPVVSIAAKQKELVGDCKNGGRAWQPQGHPELVRVPDFPDQTLGKATPYGVFDVTANPGWVSVGTDHDTATFAVDTVGRWWAQMGTPTYPGATDLLLLADGGGSTSSRSRRWKIELQRLADATGLRVPGCHFPPGTSKWHQIEHGMCSHSTQNWRGRPLISHEVIVALLGPTTTQTGLRIQAELNQQSSPIGTVVSDAALAAVRLDPATLHGNWNYTSTPQAATI